MRKIEEGLELDSGRPEQGLWPDVRRVIRSIVAKRQTENGVEFQVKSKGRNGFKWVPEIGLPDVIREVYEAAHGSSEQG